MLWMLKCCASKLNFRSFSALRNKGERKWTEKNNNNDADDDDDEEHKKKQFAILKHKWIRI